MDAVRSLSRQGASRLNHDHFNNNTVLEDYRIAHLSRQGSIVGRQEVFAGRAKFGIFGDGKEVPQVALAHAFKKGDIRSGYYRDQTLMLALGVVTIEQLFAQLYAHADVRYEPCSGGRSMTGHFATRLLDEGGSWRNQLLGYNSSADLSPTTAQMPRLVGLALASKLYRSLPELKSCGAAFSDNGNEIVVGTIGNAGCAEGPFWEALNAIGVLQVPMLLSIWDDGYGISVPNELQVTKADHAKILQGFRPDRGSEGIEVYRVKGWDYPHLVRTYKKAAEAVRTTHVPAVVHVTELTQPQGHSTSGSAERYKSNDRIRWERRFDCLGKMREWLLREGIARPEELNEIEQEQRKNVLAARDAAWDRFRSEIECDRAELLQLLDEVQSSSAAPVRDEIGQIRTALESRNNAQRRDLAAAAEETLIALRQDSRSARSKIAGWKEEQLRINSRRYDSHLYSESSESALKIPEIAPIYSEKSPTAAGFEILNACFDAAFRRCPQLIAMGEDVGRLGDVNQGFAHLQEHYGPLRIMDTGIREMTIVGQAIGMALRGLRPIAEVQYLDYLLYALQILSDDLATLRWRTAGGQKAPVIIRTRGHRLEGIWHSGSPIAGILNLLRGIYVCVPRDSTQAVGFYNTLLQSDDPGLVIEVLNAYRKKARIPDNVGEFTIPLGVPEVIREGNDVTVVTYGACCEIALAAAELLQKVGIEIEIVDVRTLLPFDTEAKILESLKKTNRILFLDEDNPGGATAYMMEKVLEEQGGHSWLDCAPKTATAKEHRPAYGSDGDYFSKPNREQVFEAVYRVMHECQPDRFPIFFE